MPGDVGARRYRGDSGPGAGGGMEMAFFKKIRKASQLHKLDPFHIQPILFFSTGKQLGRFRENSDGQS